MKRTEMNRITEKKEELLGLLKEENPGEVWLGFREEKKIYCFDGAGTDCGSPVFDHAFFGDYRVGIFAKEPLVCEMQGDLLASLDDMAQILGYRVPLRERSRIRGRRCAYLVRGEGVLVLGRTPGEAVTALRMVRKALLVEIRGRRLGGTKKLNPLLAALEHLVYQKKYSRNEVRTDR